MQHGKYFTTSLYFAIYFTQARIRSLRHIRLLNLQFAKEKIKITRPGDNNHNDLCEGATHGFSDPLTSLIAIGFVLVEIFLILSHGHVS